MFKYTYYIHWWFKLNAICVSNLFSHTHFFESESNINVQWIHDKTCISSWLSNSHIKCTFSFYSIKFIKVTPSKWQKMNLQGISHFSFCVFFPLPRLNKHINRNLSTYITYLNTDTNLHMGRRVTHPPQFTSVDAQINLGLSTNNYIYRFTQPGKK